MTAFLLMAKQAVVAETHRAERTVKLLTMKNFVPAFAAFDSSIDQLKHQIFIARVLMVGANMVSSRWETYSRLVLPSTRLITVAPIVAMKTHLAI
jgi:hypothetical protein